MLLQVQNLMTFPIENAGADHDAGQDGNAAEKSDVAPHFRRFRRQRAFRGLNVVRCHAFFLLL